MVGPLLAEVANNHASRTNALKGAGRKADHGACWHRSREQDQPHMRARRGWRGGVRGPAADRGAGNVVETSGSLPRVAGDLQRGIHGGRSGGRGRARCAGGTSGGGAAAGGGISGCEKRRAGCPSPEQVFGGSRRRAAASACPVAGVAQEAAAADPARRAGDRSNNSRSW